MDDANKTKEQLVDELDGMRNRVAELESEIEYTVAEAQRRLREQVMLFDVSRSMAGAFRQSEEIANNVIRQFVEVMGVDESSLSLLNAQGDALEVVTSFFWMTRDMPVTWSMG